LQIIFLRYGASGEISDDALSTLSIYLPMYRFWSKIAPHPVQCLLFVLHIHVIPGTSLKTAIKILYFDTIRNALLQQTTKLSTFNNFNCLQFFTCKCWASWRRAL